MEKKSMAQMIRDLNPGQVADFPLSKDNSVRVTCTRISYETGALLKCNRHRDTCVVTVTRVRRPPRKARHNSVGQ
jgi:hypothetical protein